MHTAARVFASAANLCYELKAVEGMKVGQGYISPDSVTNVKFQNLRKPRASEFSHKMVRKALWLDGRLRPAWFKGRLKLIGRGGLESRAYYSTRDWSKHNVEGGSFALESRHSSYVGSTATTFGLRVSSSPRSSSSSPFMGAAGTRFGSAFGAMRTSSSLQIQRLGRKGPRSFANVHTLFCLSISCCSTGGYFFSNLQGRLLKIRPGRGRAVCVLMKEEHKQQASTKQPANLEKEAHKYFDQVVITVRAGDGGHGSVLDMPVAPAPPRYTPGDKYEKQRKNNEKGKKKTGSLKRGSDGSLQLPMGGHGGDVILVADESIDSLLEFHKKRRFNAKRGGNVNASGPLTPAVRDGLSAPTLLISVPVGTVVKRKKGGKLLADLSRVGDKYLVARGGQGGISVLEAPKQNRRPLRNVDPAIITDPDDKVLTLGGTGEEIVLELTLQVVADVGLVGLPNAGKSSLLAAVTRATPDIADYPFTTLMPNLGQLPGGFETEDGGSASRATLADLPGLIKGAHLGKGLGRMFLRHLRRTRLLLHVVDSSADDPIRDYKTLREELYMYNPDYVKRPHIVLLNKLDLPKARTAFEANREIISKMGIDPETDSLEGEPTSGNILPILQGDGPDNIPAEDDKQDVSVSKSDRGVEDYRRPVAVIGISAKEGLGMEELLSSIRDALERDETKVENKPRRQPRPQMYKPPQWQI